ncbi:hypothetical protein SAMN04487948_11850 [Halogranum amylolyticum]|uniref:Uncharacterized protein n=1 Tax=Halogranum amylolyticum TaxID=660520 RepID=A0A1H8VP35_9EURY|nr:hypothetical protein SAMN04487948_11850 [Halogranum amylolyticum]
MLWILRAFFSAKQVQSAENLGLEHCEMLINNPMRTFMYLFVLPLIGVIQ